MINDYENGGLRMLDLNSFNKALKLSWVRKYLNDNNSDSCCPSVAFGVTIASSNEA